MNWYEIRDSGAITGWSEHKMPIERQTDYALYTLVIRGWAGWDEWVAVDHSGFSVRGLEGQTRIAVPVEVRQAAAEEWCRRYPSYDGTKQWARQAHIAAHARMGTQPAGSHGSIYARDYR